MAHKNRATTARNALGLLRVYETIMQELKASGVLRSNNNPLADFAEFLFAETFDWELTPKSTKGHDAVDKKEIRYEIKARRLSQENGSRQLSAIRDINGHNFDFLAGVLFDPDFSIIRAAIIPWEIIKERSSHVESTNSAKFILRDDIWELSGVLDVTADLQAALSDG